MWFWTDYLLAFVIFYVSFLIAACLAKGTKFGDALLKFAAQPKPTTAAGWLEMETHGVFGGPTTPALAAAPPAAAKQPAAGKRGRKGRKRA